MKISNETPRILRMEVGKTNDAQTWLKNVLENAFVDNEEEFWEEK